MRRIYVYGLTDGIEGEFVGDFVDWFEHKFYVSMDNWTYLENETWYLDMNWKVDECENISNQIKEKFPETKVEVFEFVMNNTPIIRV